MSGIGKEHLIKEKTESFEHFVYAMSLLAVGGRERSVVRLDDDARNAKRGERRKARVFTSFFYFTHMTVLSYRGLVQQPGVVPLGRPVQRRASILTATQLADAYVVTGDTREPRQSIAKVSPVFSTPRRVADRQGTVKGTNRTKPEWR